VYLCGYRSFRAFLASSTPLSAAILRRGSTSLKDKGDTHCKYYVHKMDPLPSGNLIFVAHTLEILSFLVEAKHKLFFFSAKKTNFDP